MPNMQVTIWLWGKPRSYFTCKLLGLDILRNHRTDEISWRISLQFCHVLETS